jgi:hypothetical protein
MLHRVRLDGVLATVAAALLSVAACRDVTEPARARPIAGPVASHNTVDSPDVGTVVLGSVNSTKTEARQPQRASITHTRPL